MPLIVGFQFNLSSSLQVFDVNPKRVLTMVFGLFGQILTFQINQSQIDMSPGKLQMMLAINNRV